SFLQSSQGFLPLDYSQDELQEDLINVEDMISSDDEKEHGNDPVFDLEQSLYEYALASAEFKNDPWKEFSAEDIPILQEISNEETGDEYIEEIPVINTKQTTPCIIINNDHGEIQCCNRESAKRLRELISVWEIDEDAVNDVNKELHRKADPECTAMHLGDTETTLLHFAKLIEMVAYSENDIIKKNLLQDLVLCIENFNLDSSSASSSKLPSLFVVNTILKIKKIDFSKQQLIQKPKKYEEFGKLLALEVLKSHTSLAPYKSILESPDSLQQYYEAIPKCLTSLFYSLIRTLLFQKYEIVRQKQKERKSTITEFDESEIVKSTAFLFSIILTTTFKGWKFWLPQVIGSFSLLASYVELCGKNPFVEKWMENLTQIFRRLMAEYPMEFTMDEINIALKEAKNVIQEDEDQRIWYLTMLEERQLKVKSEVWKKSNPIKVDLKRCFINFTFLCSVFIFENNLGWEAKLSTNLEAPIVQQEISRKWSNKPRFYSVKRVE
ncbi:4340_t:CDS:2, partial [Dentiscutata erythropus]